MPSHTVSKSSTGGSYIAELKHVFIDFKTEDLNSVEGEKFHGYLPLSPVFVCKVELEIIVGILRVDIVDAWHEVGEVDSLAQHSKEDVVRNVCHHSHA